MKFSINSKNPKIYNIIFNITYIKNQERGHKNEKKKNRKNRKNIRKDENGNKEYQGILKGFNENSIMLENEIKIERKNIAQIKTIYNW